MSRAEALRRILRPAALEEVDARTVVLKEQTGQRDKRQTFTLLTGETQLAVVRVDKFSHSSMLEGSWKKCDYALFVSRNDREEALLIEMKKTRKNHSSPFAQLRQSVPILEYLDALARTEALPDDDPVKTTPVKVHYAVLYERDGRNLDKQATRGVSVTASGCEVYHGMNIRWRIGQHAALSDLLSAQG